MLFCIATPPPNFLCLQQALALLFWVLYLWYNFFVNSDPEVIQYASTITEIPDIDKAFKKTLLFHNSQPCEKKSGDPDSDEPTGCYDGADIFKLVEIFILNKLSNIIDKNSIGLYHDGLGLFNKLPGLQIGQMKKKTIKIFKDSGLSITVTSNIPSVDFLDITSNLKTESY